MAGNTSVPEIFTDGLCNLENHAGVVWNNRIYIVGGNQRIYPPIHTYSINATKYTDYSSRHMRILDFTSSVDVSSTDIISTHPVPDDKVPPLKYANVFAEDGKLHMFGGEQEYWGMVHDDGTAYESTYRRPTNIDQLFTYDIQRQEWDATSLGLGERGVFAGNVAYNEKNKTAWVYGGEYSDSGYYTANPGDNLNFTWVPGGTEPREYLTSLVRYDIPQSKAAYVDLPLNAVGHTSWGSLTFIPGVGKEGVLILFGGMNFDTTMRTMGKIHVLDIASSTWYTQDASSESGNQPQDRRRFCTVLVSASDGSSHNIFMYGGVDKDANIPYKDVFVLSIPSFHWIYIGAAPMGKFGHTCHKLQERYLITYRGNQVRDIPTPPTCDSENGGIQIYDMETLEWTTKYEVKKGGTATYKIPERLYSIIGGGSTGNATFKSPKKGWTDSKLGELFKTSDPTTTTEIEISRATEDPASNPPSETPSEAPSDSPSDPATNKVAIAGGVVGGIIIIGFMIFAVLWYRRRKRSQLQGQPVSQDSLSELPEYYPMILAEVPGNQPIPVEAPGDLPSFTPAAQLMSEHYNYKPHAT